MRLLRLTWRLVFVSLLVLSLTVNIALFISGSLYQLASSAFEAVTSIRTVAARQADEVASSTAEITENRAARQKMQGELTEVSGDLATERALNRKLRGELTGVASDLTAERTLTRQLRGELTDPLTRIVPFRGKNVAIREAVDATADRISKRAVVASSREVGSMAAEAIPFIGIAVIVGAAALELKDLCDTLKDMNALQQALDPAANPNADEDTICAMKPPTKEELWAKAKSSPGEAWTRAKEAIPTLEEVKSFELPDIDWKGAGFFIAEGTGNAWVATKDGTGAAVAATQSATSDLIERTRGRIWGDSASSEDE